MASSKNDFLDECYEHFGSKDLYEILALEKTANEKQIKSAYRQKSLKVHPDRAPEDRKEQAKRAFQVLTKVHVVLTNENLRQMYDETGMVITDEDSSLASFSSFEEYESYWRGIFPKITTKQIDDFLKKYIGSDEEKTDLKGHYMRFEGDLNKIFEYHFHYEEDRVVNMIKEFIAAEEVPAFDAFVNEPKAKKEKRIKRIEKEKSLAEKETEKRAKKSKKAKHDSDDENGDVDDMSALQLAIQGKNKTNFDNLMDSLEAKYATKKGGAKSKKPRRK